MNNQTRMFHYIKLGLIAFNILLGVLVIGILSWIYFIESSSYSIKRIKRGQMYFDTISGAARQRNQDFLTDSKIILQQSAPSTPQYDEQKIDHNLVADRHSDQHIQQEAANDTEVVLTQGNRIAIVVVDVPNSKYVEMLQEISKDIAIGIEDPDLLSTRSNADVYLYGDFYSDPQELANNCEKLNCKGLYIENLPSKKSVNKIQATCDRFGAKNWNLVLAEPTLNKQEQTCQDGASLMIPDVFIGPNQSNKNIKSKLAELGRIAQKQGFALCYIKADPSSIKALKVWLKSNDAKDLRIVRTRPTTSD